MDLTSEIFRKVFQYLDDRISLEDIEGWLVPHLYELLILAPCSASELAGVIELGLAEISAHIEADRCLQCGMFPNKERSSEA